VTGRVAYFNCAAGVAGDMLLGALIDAGADASVVEATVAGLGVAGWTLSFERTQRGGITATHAVVETEGEGHPHRPVSEIRGLLDDADLTARVRDRAWRVFDTLAAVEAAIHGVPADEVVFHEVGAIDAIVDVLGVCAALDALGVDRVVSSAVAVGHGTVRTSHGDLPNPPPAVARLFATRDVPIVGVDTTMEISTPTGVALLVALADSFGALPAVAVESVGWGAGTADPAGRPNVVQVLIGTPAAAATAPRPGRTAVVLEVNVDDVTGEVLAHTVAALLAAGAHDAWAAPIVMKKGRPAHTAAALVDPADVDRLATVLLAETGSLGLRATSVERWPQRRAEATIDVGGHPVRVKVADGRAKPEHDDAVAAARALGRPLRDVLREAETRALDGDAVS
jgi:pyridinium-3,5-bisthiocarboxylic acid mononucleotide nickel chelatase